jgi:DNA-binding PadR family transcriptional regulator
MLKMMRHNGHGRGPGFGPARGFGPRGGGFGRGFQRGPDGEGRGGGRRRVFDSGELRLVLLKLIGDQPRHGYDLIREIEALSGGAYVPSPGVIYPTLTLLVDMGHIDETKGEGARKRFDITAEGRQHLDERAADVAALLARLADLGAQREKTESGPVRRAMMNLKTVLHQRLTNEDVGAETLHEVAAILDAAAQKIERL